MLRSTTLILIAAVWLAGFVPALADDPIALRITNMGVTPAHMPVVKVWAKNQSDAAYEGSVTLELPDGWTLDPAMKDVSLKPGETTSLSFTIHNGKTREDNRYEVTAIADGAGQVVRRSQQVVAASVPYFKPEIDGKTDDWKDAIPVTFITQGKKTTISTLWNRRQFSMLVAVEEDKWLPWSNSQEFDAVQIAISPQDTMTSTEAEDKATRYEYLLTSGGAGQGGRLFQLAEPGTKLGDTQAERNLDELEIDDPKLAVWREGITTYYEWGISFRSLKKIRPSEGREFFLSVLVHDPDGTGVRDWGEAAGLWSCQRNRLAWSVWPGARWSDKMPMDNKVEWGMCSSKY